MYAIVEIAGKQFKVAQQHQLYTPRLAAKVGENVSFDRVLLLGSDKGIKVGAPLVKKATVTGKVLAHVKADKVVVFKKKRRKGFKRTQGHRQGYTQISIEAIKSE